MESKQCFACGEVKLLSEFYAHPGMTDGHLNKCKECVIKYTRSRRQGDDRQKILAYDVMRSKMPERKKKAAAITKAWAEKHPDRRKAQQILSNAVRDGKTAKLPCFVCGKKAEAHHPDYSRPLDVVWLCTEHHRQTHALYYHLTKPCAAPST